MEEVFVIFKVIYTLYDKDLPKEDIYGFELGYISFLFGENNEIYNDKKNQPTMIFLTISELISGLAEYEGKKLDYKEIIGVDCSLSICFKRVKEFTKIIINSSFSTTIETMEVLKEFYDSSINFCKAYYSFLDTSVRHDLEYAFNELKGKNEKKIR